MAKYQIYGIGNALVDKEFEVTDEFFAQAGIEKGQMTLIEQSQQEALLAKLTEQFGLKKRAGGGSAANTIFAAQYLGSKTFYTCNVANDETGDFFLKDLTSAGIDTNLGGEREEGVTGKCMVMITPDAERTMNTYLGITANLNHSHINEAALKDSEYLYFEGYLVSSDTARNAAIEGKKIAQANGVKTAMTFSDPAMVQFFKDGLTDMLGNGVDLLFCNEEEALGFTGTENLTDAMSALKSVTKTFAITCGSKGAVLFDGNNTIEIAPHNVTAIDSNGAGDNFAGAFLHALTSGHSWEESGKLASKISAQVVSQFGPRLAAEQYPVLKSEVL
ncbi:adenosine kinase [Oceaniserpentilla sp. 4NH20-0058]|uniref:adenosine kinase n=1 Tax=Oceaniserpentilla sp. 4NH20-0058 TaxID=3127660 RepID=UPI00310C015B